ncbi:unnamed protein product, partial [Ectocarpus sp. 12 AP-2014]
TNRVKGSNNYYVLRDLIAGYVSFQQRETPQSIFSPPAKEKGRNFFFLLRRIHAAQNFSLRQAADSGPIQLAPAVKKYFVKKFRLTFHEKQEKRDKKHGSIWVVTQ